MNEQKVSRIFNHILFTIIFIVFMANFYGIIKLQNYNIYDDYSLENDSHAEYGRIYANETNIGFLSFMFPNRTVNIELKNTGYTFFNYSIKKYINITFNDGHYIVTQSETVFEGHSQDLPRNFSIEDNYYYSLMIFPTNRDNNVYHISYSVKYQYFKWGNQYQVLMSYKKITKTLIYSLIPIMILDIIYLYYYRKYGSIFILRVFSKLPIKEEALNILQSEKLDWRGYVSLRKIFKLCLKKDFEAALQLFFPYIEYFLNKRMEKLNLEPTQYNGLHNKLEKLICEKNVNASSIGDFPIKIKARNQILHGNWDELSFTEEYTAYTLFRELFSIFNNIVTFL